MPALAALTNQDIFEAPQTAACLPLKLCLWTAVIRCYSQGKKRSLLPPLLYPHWLSFISFPARESQRHSNQNLCKLTPNVTQYYKWRKMLIFFFFSLGLWMLVAHTSTMVLILWHPGFPLHGALFWRYQSTESCAGTATSSWRPKGGSEARALGLWALHLLTVNAEKNAET